jgi:hypothetical protein
MYLHQWKISLCKESNKENYLFLKHIRNNKYFYKIIIFHIDLFPYIAVL